MLVAITGTPGTGKTSVSKILQKDGYKIIDVQDIAIENNYFIGFDEKRNSKILDIKKIDEFLIQNYNFDEIIFVESHLSHLLKNVEKIIILRCHPKILKKRLISKGWNENKIKENIDAEILDIILCEAVESNNEKNIFEIDTTSLEISNVASSIIEIIDNNFKEMIKYKIGHIDWSEEIIKDT